MPQASVWPEEAATTPLEESLQRMVQGGTALSRLMAADVVRFWVAPTEPRLCSPAAEWQAYTSLRPPASGAALTRALQLIQCLMEAAEAPPYGELSVKLTAMHTKAVRPLAVFVVVESGWDYPAMRLPVQHPAAPHTPPCGIYSVFPRFVLWRRFVLWKRSYTVRMRVGCGVSPAACLSSLAVASVHRRSHASWCHVSPTAFGCAASQCHLARQAQAAGSSNAAVTTTLELSGAVELAMAIQLTEDTKDLVNLGPAR